MTMSFWLCRSASAPRGSGVSVGGGASVGGGGVSDGTAVGGGNGVSVGNGVVHACSVIHRAPPAHKDAAPYVVALIDLAEGFRMMSRIVDCDPETVAVGQNVHVVYRDDSDGKPAPYFAPTQ